MKKIVLLSYGRSEKPWFITKGQYVIAKTYFVPSLYGLLLLAETSVINNVKNWKENKLSFIWLSCCTASNNFMSYIFMSFSCYYVIGFCAKTKSLSNKLLLIQSSNFYDCSFKALFLQYDHKKWDHEFSFGATSFVPI